MQSLLFVAPYGGVYRPEDVSRRIPHGARPLHRITVFHSEVRYPKPATRYEVLPDDLLQYLHRVFEKDERGPFPAGLLDRLQFVACPRCAVEHARAACPFCSAGGGRTPRAVLMVRGEVLVHARLRDPRRRPSRVRREGRVALPLSRGRLLSTRGRRRRLPGRARPEPALRDSGALDAGGPRRRARRAVARPGTGTPVRRLRRHGACVRVQWPAPLLDCGRSPSPRCVLRPRRGVDGRQSVTSSPARRASGPGRRSDWGSTGRRTCPSPSSSIRSVAGSTTRFDCRLSADSSSTRRALWTSAGPGFCSPCITPAGSATCA